MLKYTKPFLESLEQIIAEIDYSLRYEKGNFKSGYCLLNESKVIVINRYFTLEGKIASLAEIIRVVPFDEALLSEKSKKRLLELRAA
jgi:hypothetical protein